MVIHTIKSLFILNCLPIIFFIFSTSCAPPDNSQNEPIEISPRQASKDFSKLTPLIEKKLQIENAIQSLVQSAGLGSLDNVEQIKIFLEINSEAKSIVKEYVIRNNYRAGLNKPLLIIDFFLKPLESELAMSGNFENLKWLLFMKDKTGAFHAAFENGHDVGIRNINNFETYAKLKLKVFKSFIDTNQLNALGDFKIN